MDLVSLTGDCLELVRLSLLSSLVLPVFRFREEPDRLRCGDEDLDDAREGCMDWTLRSGLLPVVLRRGGELGRESRCVRDGLAHDLSQSCLSLLQDIKRLDKLRLLLIDPMDWLWLTIVLDPSPDMERKNPT